MCRNVAKTRYAYFRNPFPSYILRMDCLRCSTQCKYLCLIKVDTIAKINVFECTKLNMFKCTLNYHEHFYESVKRWQHPTFLTIYSILLQEYHSISHQLNNPFNNYHYQNYFILQWKFECQHWKTNPVHYQFVNNFPAL